MYYYGTGKDNIMTVESLIMYYLNGYSIKVSRDGRLCISGEMK